MAGLPPGRVVWPRPFQYIGGQVTLRAMKRAAFGVNHLPKTREQGFVPARLQGDFLPDKPLQLFRNELMKPEKAPGFERRLVRLLLDDGEDVLALPKEVKRTLVSRFAAIHHIGFVRWPRDPQTHPLKLNIPITVVNEEKIPVIKRGGYVHNMFYSIGGLPCIVETPDFPHTLVADMDLADAKGDFRYEHLKAQLPPGVRLQTGLRGFTEHPNFLVARAKRVRGS